MLLLTSKGEYQAFYAAVAGDGDLYAEIADTRTISLISPEFEGLETIERIDEIQGDETYTGYTQLVGVNLSSAGAMIHLKRGETNG
jgi:hypothetical protein